MQREPQKKLNGKQRRHLRSLGHHLEPVVQIGKEGLSQGVFTAVDEAVERHELVKLRVGTECPTPRKAVAEQLAAALGVQVAQILGRTILVYRRHPTEPVLKLPGEELS